MTSSFARRTGMSDKSSSGTFSGSGARMPAFAMSRSNWAPALAGSGAARRAGVWAS